MRGTAITPTELLDASRAMLCQPRPGTRSVWSRAAALLARQALEARMDELWRQRRPGVEQASARCQLLCLPAFLDDELAGRVAHAWAALSHACHHHPYELSPTAEELERWVDTVEALIRC
jgi:hypothetical protein